MSATERQSDAARCVVCKRERTPEDKDYSPIQIMTGQPCGWYSGDDGEICGHDMDVMQGIGKQR